MRDEPEDDDDWSEPAYENEDEFEPEPTRECPCCRYEMLEICMQCPSCGQYLSKEDVNTVSQPRWIILGAFLCLGVVLFWFLTNH